MGVEIYLEGLSFHLAPYAAWCGPGDQSTDDLQAFPECPPIFQVVLSILSILEREFTTFLGS